MKLVTYIQSVTELNHFIELKNEELAFELILGCRELSRYTQTSFDELLELINLCGKNKLPVVLEWDALYQEEKFSAAKDFFDRLPLHDVLAVRVQDPGAVHYLKTKYPWLKIQLILENGNHNLIGLIEWANYLGDQCERLILSNELSKEKLQDYAKVLDLPIEVLAFGRILLFYSPRLLLSPLEKEHMHKSWIETTGSSEESPHTGFPLIENRHGTFMFNVKDLSLLDQLSVLGEMGIHHARVDLRFDQSQAFLLDIIDLFSGKNAEVETLIKNKHVRPLIKGFYNVNKTDVLFTKLKNKRTQRQDQNYIGEIVDVERDIGLALLVKTETLGNRVHYNFKMITPEGKEKRVTPLWIRSSLGESVSKIQKNDLVIIPYVSGVTVKTQIYLCQD